ncbi:hypothetical protein C8R43DRAFT_1027992 [Mycena crocata]|nr:hypothetical protein C8R43DRAFT_1027992 [Mycena crocata]
MHVNLLAGPILIGTQLNWGLFGLLTVQVYLFHVSFPEESLGIKALVYTLFLLDSLQTAFATHFAFDILVTGWGNPSTFVRLPWTSCTLPVMAGLVAAIVQIYFAWRIHALRGKSIYVRIICGIIVVTALMQGLSGMVNGIRFAFAPTLAAQQKLTAGVKIWLIGSFACDIIIAVTMIVILSQMRSVTPWTPTDSLIKKLLYHTVETGAVTAITAGVELILFILYPETFLDEIPAFLLGKMYSNVVLATLNARTRKRASWPVASAIGFATPDVESHQLRFRESNTAMSNTDYDMELTRKESVPTV